MTGDHVPQHSGRMALVAFIVPTGHHEASWRLPASPAERIYDIDYYTQLARHAESAGLDAVFFADAPALRTAVAYNTGGSLLEPLTLAAAIAGATSRIGIIVTASTTYNEPYNLARALSSLDHISRGRIGWNMVTTAHAGAATNFGAIHADRRSRYERADEFVCVTKALWESWAAGAIVCDRTAGQFADTRLVRRIDHSGKHFEVSGPFQSARSPQCHPVLVQAGASPAGRAFAARHAEVVFSVQRDREAAAGYRRDLINRAMANERPMGVPISLPGLSVHVARNARDAREKAALLDALIIPAYGIQQIRTITGVDLSGLELDDIVSPADFGTIDETSSTTRRDEIVAMVSEEAQTLRCLLTRIAGARTHRVVVGSPSEIADTMHHWFSTGACDGFNLMPPTLPDGLLDFTTLVLPELTRRGSWYPEDSTTPTTLRARLGLRLPP